MSITEVGKATEIHLRNFLFKGIHYIFRITNILLIDLDTAAFRDKTVGRIFFRGSYLRFDSLKGTLAFYLLEL